MNELTSKKLAKLLDGAQYPLRLGPEIARRAKNYGLVIVYGGSDDLMEFDGAIIDEVGCYGGCTALVDHNGLLPSRESIESDAELKDFFKREELAKRITAHCSSDGYLFTYNTKIKHECFSVYDGGEIYCRGIVFLLSDAGGKADDIFWP